jgi:hypothetical protein
MPSRTPPTSSELLELLRRTMPSSYWDRVLRDPMGLGRLIEAIAESFAVLGRRLSKMAHAGNYLPYGENEEEPATFARRSSCQVTLRRTRDTWRAVEMAAGTVWLAGPQGRNYTNATAIAWPPYGVTEQTVTFEAEFAGWTYDLDFLADEEGFITAPGIVPRIPWRSEIDLRGESVRAGARGSIVTTAGQPSAVVDAGAADVFNAGDVGRYVFLNDTDEPANRRRVLRVLSHAREVEDVPVGSGLRPNTITVDDAAETLVLQAVVADDGGVLTVETGGPYTLLPDVPAVGDAYYFALHTPFVRLDLDITTAADGDHELAWEVWTGAAWVAVPRFTDGTSGFRQGGRLELDEPAGWATTTVAGISGYWLRARVTAVTSSTGAEAAAAYAGVHLGLVAEEATVSWTMLRWQDLGFEVAQLTAPVGGRDDTLSMLGDERRVYPQRNEDEDAFRHRAARLPEAISPLALQAGVNRVLAPFGLKCRMIDRMTDGYGVPPGFKGLYYDLPPELTPEWMSYYDLPEEDAGTMVPIADWQATRHIWVYLPPLGQGFFGAVYDGVPGGPEYVLEDGTVIASYYDLAYYDGFPLIGASVYAQIYETLNSLKLAGVSFSILLDPDLLNPC